VPDYGRAGLEVSNNHRHRACSVKARCERLSMDGRLDLLSGGCRRPDLVSHPDKASLKPGDIRTPCVKPRHGKGSILFVLQRSAYALAGIGPAAFDGVQLGAAR
jgi:hypothetical protein